MARAEFVPMPRKYQEQLMRSHAEANRPASRETFWDLVRTCGHMAFWLLCGWALIGLSAHTTDTRLGWPLFWAGITVWIPGVLFSLLAAYRRGERRGDW
jgi:hypothetical protein